MNNSENSNFIQKIEENFHIFYLGNRIKIIGQIIVIFFFIFHQKTILNKNYWTYAHKVLFFLEFLFLTRKLNFRIEQ